MALSNDPEKRARSLANLRKGPAAAAKNFGLEVEGYDPPEQAPKPQARKRSTTAKAAPRPAAEPKPPTANSQPDSLESSGPSMLLVVGGGLLLLVILVVVLNRVGPRPEDA